MSAPLLRTFGRFEDASSARDALVAAGLPPSAVAFRVIEDEAGPVEGNFVAGNGRTESGRTPARGILVGSEIPYDKNFADTVSRGGHLLLVEPADEQQRAQALAILDRFESVDVDQASAGGGRAG
jgi:hypothetical protein